MSIWVAVLTVALGAALPMHALADSPSLLTEVHAGTQPLPLFPPGELRRGREGWVLVDLVVSREGVVRDARIVDSSGNGAFDEVSLNTLRRWEYPRVTRNMKSRVLVNFEFYRTSPQVSRRFFIRYRQAHHAINNGDLEEAQDLVHKMRRDRKLNVFELAYTNIVAGHLAAEHGNRAGQLSHFRHAMLNRGRWLEDRTYRHLLHAVVVLEIQEEDFASALRDYSLLTETALGRELAADLDEPIRMVRSIVDDEHEITPPFMIADQEVSVRRERPRLRTDPIWRGKDVRPKNSIAEREYQRMK